MTRRHFPTDYTALATTEDAPSGITVRIERGAMIEILQHNGRARGNMISQLWPDEAARIAIEILVQVGEIKRDEEDRKAATAERLAAKAK